MRRPTPRRLRGAGHPTSNARLSQGVGDAKGDRGDPKTPPARYVSRQCFSHVFYVEPVFLAHVKDGIRQGEHTIIVLQLSFVAEP